jgi:uncharacterized protein YndB with AHSA1/START domain
MEIKHNTIGYEIERAFSNSQEVLFKALTDSNILKSIWGVQNITVNAKTGGQARAIYRVNEQNWDFTITYIEVVPYEKLRWVTHFDSHPTKETKVTILINHRSRGSKVVVRMENFENQEECDANKKAWEEALDKLKVILKP